MARAGTVLGPIILVIVAIITDHCCALIVKCKREAVRQAMQRSGTSTTARPLPLCCQREGRESRNKTSHCTAS